jgi:hypothetical protein
LVSARRSWNNAQQNLLLGAHNGAICFLDISYICFVLVSMAYRRDYLMRHPEGRALAVQQQMYFATILAEKFDLDTETILRKLAIAGMTLGLDTEEITADAAAILPKINPEDMITKLRLVTEGDIIK